MALIVLNIFVTHKKKNISSNQYDILTSLQYKTKIYLTMKKAILFLLAVLSLSSFGQSFTVTVSSTPET